MERYLRGHAMHSRSSSFRTAYAQHAGVSPHPNIPTRAHQIQRIGPHLKVTAAEQQLDLGARLAVEVLDGCSAAPRVAGAIGSGTRDTPAYMSSSSPCEQPTTAICARRGAVSAENGAAPQTFIGAAAGRSR
jgi:hypothetical protein